MSLVNQVSLLPAGCQPWNIGVCAASGDRFAYCATLAIYIYQLDLKYNEFKLHSIMSEHKKTVTAISWNSKDHDLIISGSADSEIIIWNVPQQSVVSRLSKLRDVPLCVGWKIQDVNVVSFVSGRGPLVIWNYSAVGATFTFHKEAQNFSSDVCQFRWHHKLTGKLAFGHNDGSISLFNTGKKPQKHVLRPSDTDEADEGDDPVIGLEWDPLSNEYLLIARTHSGVTLIDADALSVIQKFTLPSAAARVHTVAWINSAPGMFVTGDTQNGVMRIWSVAKSTPLENLKLKKTGFHSLHVFTTAPGKSTDEESDQHTGYVMPTMSPAGRYALPPAYAVCTFLDGGVGLYDLGKRRWYFLRDQGHIETIFDCKFKPESSEFLATASFDGTIKIWDVNTLTAINSSPGNEGVIYCLSWAPADLDCVAASTSKNGVFIWDLKKNKIIKRYKEHGQNSVYSVAWNQKDSRRIASAGGDGTCIVRQVDGTLLAKFRHHGPAFGCDWNPNNKDLIATGCDDGIVRVFYLPTANNPSKQPLKTFAGHEAKVFNVRWSPLRDGWLCSGSDDGTTRIWDYTKDNCIMVLKGHSAPVRGLLWNTEIPYLLVTGSWDYSMRIWDVRDGACLDTVLDHGADVYGLTSHPDRPFVFASSSRDSTVRLWSLNPILQPLEINVIAGKDWDDIIASPEQAISVGAPPLLCGKASKDLKSALERVSDVKNKTLQSFSKFFSSPKGSSNLWELVSVVRGMDGSGLSDNYDKGIMHIKHLLKFKSAKAQELEIMKTSKFGGGGIGSKSRDDRLREAAEIYVRIGNLQRYCDVLAELGEWDKALAVAPGVSMQYWKSLCERRVSSLKEEESELIVPYAVAAGDVESLVQHFTSIGQLQDAMMAATAGHEGNISVPNAYSAHANGVQNGEGDYVQMLTKTARELADWYLRNGCAVIAACCHLAINDCQGAIAKLLRGNELELAVSAGTVLGNTQELVQIGTKYLSRRCERLGKWELGVDLLKAFPDKLPLAQLCARCAASMAEKNDLYQKAGFPSMEECWSVAERHRGDTLRCVMYYVLSTQPEKGLEIGLQYVNDTMSRQTWTVSEVWDVIQMMASVQTEKLQQHKCSSLKADLLIISAYVGALVAIRRRYNAIVVPLFKHTMQLFKKEPNSKVLLSESLLSSELDAFIIYQEFKNESKSRSPTRRRFGLNTEQQNVLDDVFRKAGEDTAPFELGEDIASSSNLPCHSDVHESYFTKKRIQGPAFFLEDGRSAIAISEALMWAKVTPFSPLGSGVRINPF